MPAARGATYLAVIGIPPRETGRKESDAVFHPNQLRTGEPLPIAPSVPAGACLVAGCTCKDARIVSFRRAAFFAAFGGNGRIIGTTPAHPGAPSPQKANSFRQASLPAVQV